MSHLEWQRLGNTDVQKVGYRTIVTKHFRLPDGREKEFQTISAEGTQFAGCIALTELGKVIIAREFRPGPEVVMEDIPGGLVEPGESPEQAALRELEEETGYQAGRIIPLGRVYKDAYHNATWHYFLAEGCRPNGIGQRLDDNEVIGVGQIGIERLLDNARHGRMTDVEAVFLAYEYLRGVQIGGH